MSDSIIARLAELGTQPFATQVVQSPWLKVIDVPSHHAKAKERIKELLAGCGQPVGIRGLTIIGQPGAGKTHLLAWAREHAETTGTASFVYVHPYLPGDPGTRTFDQHVMQATIDALYTQSVPQRAAFETVVRKFLVRCYDCILDEETSDAVQSMLGIGGTGWLAWLSWLVDSRRRYLLAPKPRDEQLAALRIAFRSRQFLDRAFTIFAHEHRSVADGVHVDRDTFVAACLLTCGDGRQWWHADAWFRAARLPPDVLEPYHLDETCQGTEKIRNGLFTLQQFTGRSIIISYDQLEETHRRLSAEKSGGYPLEGLILSVPIRLLAVPHFAQLFVFQLSLWEEFHSHAMTMIVQRMQEGQGVESLAPLSQEAAVGLIRARMKVFVWSALPEVQPPDELGIFPFSEDRIRDMRQMARNRIREFLVAAQQAYMELIHPKKRRFRLIGVQPVEVRADAPTPLELRGENVPPDARVTFNGLDFPTTPICHPSEGRIELRTPANSGLTGEVVIRITDTMDLANTDTVRVVFRAKGPETPLHQRIDRAKLRERRTELGLTQTKVAKEIGCSQTQMSGLELGKWSAPPDEVFEQLAAIYGLPISAFLRDGECGDV